MIQQKKRQQREDQILSKLDELNYATRKQLQIIENLGGDRNAHRILHRMEKDRSISSVRLEKKVYYLSNRGKERIGSTKGKLKRSHIQHTLMRNDLYIRLGMPSNWKKEVPITHNDELLLVADAMFIKNNKYTFLEIDNTQTMKTNYDKIKRYADLFKMIFKQYKHHPTLIWYTLSNVRKQKLGDECLRYKVKHIVY